MLKSLNSTDPMGLVVISAGNVPQGISNWSLARATNVPWPEEQWDPFAGLACQDVPVLGVT